MTTARRYESGRLVDDSRAATPSLGWGKKSEDSLATTPRADGPVTRAPDAIDSRAAQTKVARRLPAAVVADQPAAVALPPVDGKARSVPPAVAATQENGEQIADTSDMRRFLLKQMVRAAKGEITTETVKNIVTLSQQVYNATSLELKAAAILKDRERSIRPLELVSPQDNDGK